MAPANSAGLEFGAELRRWRCQRSLSQAALARRVVHSEALIAKVEIGQRWPELVFAVACDEALDTGGVLARMWPSVAAEQQRADRRRGRSGRRPSGKQAEAAGTEVAVVESWQPSGAPSPDSAPDPALRAILNRQAISGALTPVGLVNAVDEIRHAVDDLLDDGTRGRSRLDRLEAEAFDHAREALSVAPLDMICRLGLTLADTQHLAHSKGPDVDPGQLRAVVARLSVLMADELTVLGHVPAARAWYATAAAAAKASADPRLRADVLTLAAMLPLYHGSPLEAARAAQRGRAVAGSRRWLATALAPLLQGVALGRAGDIGQARDALLAARKAYDRLEPEDRDESVFGLSPRRRLFLEGRALTTLGEYGRAWTAHRQALELYPDDVPGDPTLIYLDRAAGFIAGGNATDGAELVSATMLSLPAEHRGGLFVRAARSVLASVPVRAERLPAVRACREILDVLGPAAPDPRVSAPVNQLR